LVQQRWTVLWEIPNTHARSAQWYPFRSEFAQHSPGQVDRRMLSHHVFTLQVRNLHGQAGECYAQWGNHSISSVLIRRRKKREVRGEGVSGKSSCSIATRLRPLAQHYHQRFHDTLGKWRTRNMFKFAYPDDGRIIVLRR
jgi:hypothetical protein